MKESLETIITSLVNDPSKVSVNQVDGERGITFEVRVANEDMGKVIGKEGRIAKAIRTLIKAQAAKEGKKVSVEFID